MQPSEGVLELLSRWSEGPDVHARVMPLVYEDLRRLAGHLFANERPDHTLQATGLVNEAYIRIAAAGPFANREHFFGTAANAMRQTLVDYARRHNARKRWGSAERVELDESVAVAEAECGEIAAMDHALVNLEKINARQAQLVKLRFFTGLTLKEAASVVGIGFTTAKEEWSKAKAWLKENLEV
jgi:RNA polymerase sigma factor (TIGR02999 family)